LISLAFDTSSPVLTIALGDEESIINEVDMWLPKGHMANLIPAIDDLLKNSNLKIDDVNVIVIGSGPGSYTGLRIGMEMARTFAQLLEIPIIGIASMDAIAYRNAYNKAIICPVIDAKRGEVYTALYRITDGKTYHITGYKVLNPEELASILVLEGYERIVFAGDALKLYADVFRQLLQDKAEFAPEEDWWPRASDLIRLTRQRIVQRDFDELYRLTPIYVRLSQAEEMWEKRHQG